MFSLKLSFHIRVFELFARKNSFCCPNIRSTLSFLVCPKYILCCSKKRCRTRRKMVVSVIFFSHLLNVGWLTFGFRCYGQQQKKILRSGKAGRCLLLLSLSAYLSTNLDLRKSLQMIFQGRIHFVLRTDTLNFVFFGQSQVYPVLQREEIQYTRKNGSVSVQYCQSSAERWAVNICFSAVMGSSRKNTQEEAGRKEVQCYSLASM